MTAVDMEIKKELGSLDPLLILDQWLKTALRLKTLQEPWAMVLSTGFKNEISSRIVLLKEFSKGQLFFYTNYLSQKGQVIKSNPLVAVNFYWPSLGRQVCIKGRIEKTSREKSISYWETRSRASQMSQWLSRQSQKISSRKELESLKKQTERQFYRRQIPCPKHWGGYKLSILKIEFWKDRNYRLHDRFLFEKKVKGWSRKRLFP